MKQSDYDKVREEIDEICLKNKGYGVCSCKCPFMKHGLCIKVIATYVLDAMEGWRNEQSIQQ